MARIAHVAEDLSQPGTSARAVAEPRPSALARLGKVVPATMCDRRGCLCSRRASSTTQMLMPGQKAKMDKLLIKRRKI
jgi:hypothetical protein